VSPSDHVNHGYLHVVADRFVEAARPCVDQAFPDPTVDAFAKVWFRFLPTGRMSMRWYRGRGLWPRAPGQTEPNPWLPSERDEALGECLEAVLMTIRSPTFSAPSRWDWQVVIKRPPTMQPEPDESAVQLEPM
jgi:hypothetical protein